MLSRPSSSVVAECDTCCETLDTEEEDYASAVLALRGDGWKVVKEEGHWKHYCPCCVENLMNDFEV